MSRCPRLLSLQIPSLVYVEDLPSVTPFEALEAVKSSSRNEPMHGHINAKALIKRSKALIE
jgi:hypothetical protein